MNVGHLDKLRVKKLKKFAAIFQDVKLHWTSFNPSATRSDQWVISPHNVNTLSRRDVMRTKISISQRMSFDGTLNSQREDYDKCMSYSEEKWQLNLGVREFAKITDCRWLMLRNRFGTRLNKQKIKAENSEVTYAHLQNWLGLERLTGSHTNLSILILLWPTRNPVKQARTSAT